MKQFLETLAREILLFVLLGLLGTDIACFLGMPFDDAVLKSLGGTLMGFGLYHLSKSEAARQS